jgi:hypothetical protein
MRERLGDSASSAPVREWFHTGYVSLFKSPVLMTLNSTLGNVVTGTHRSSDDFDQCIPRYFLPCGGDFSRYCSLNSRKQKRL